MNRLLISAMVGLAGIQGIALAGETRPRLVVGIMVDQLRTDYLENLKDMFGPGGFRRLMNGGIYLKDVDFGVPGDAASAAAILQTGTEPRFNGVTGKSIYEAGSRSLKPVFNDEIYIGNFTSETYSPGALRVSTLTDEIASAISGESKIHTIAPDAAEAIALAGHAANSAFWINDETGRWASTTYYPDPPVYLQNLNYNSPLISRLDTMKWTPLRPGEPYVDLTAAEVKNGFKYTFSRSDRDVFFHYKTSPMVNRDITNSAAEYISSLNLGKNPQTTDVLNLGYTLAPYAAIADGNYNYTLQDAYLRLDKDIERLLNTLDRQVGKENMLVYLVSSGYFIEPEDSRRQNSRIPGGNFSVKRAISLLNSYFSAKYGNAAYVDSYHNRHIYLSKPLLEEKNLDPVKIAEEGRDFLVRMSGVADAFTVYDLMNPSSHRLEEERLASDPKTSGDIILTFNPGWTVTDDSVYPPQKEENKTTYYATPGFILAPGLSPKVFTEEVPATDIAPTIARILRIRSPNGVSSKGLTL